MELAASDVKYSTPLKTTEVRPGLLRVERVHAEIHGFFQEDVKAAGRSLAKFGLTEADRWKPVVSIKTVTGVDP